MIARCNEYRKDGHINDTQLHLLAICSETPRYVIARNSLEGVPCLLRSVAILVGMFLSRGAIVVQIPTSCG